MYIKINYRIILVLTVFVTQAWAGPSSTPNDLMSQFKYSQGLEEEPTDTSDRPPTVIPGTPPTVVADDPSTVIPGNPPIIISDDPPIVVEVPGDPGNPPIVTVPDDRPIVIPDDPDDPDDPAIVIPGDPGDPPILTVIPGDPGDPPIIIPGDPDDPPTVIPGDPEDPTTVVVLGDPGDPGDPPIVVLDDPDEQPIVISSDQSCEAAQNIEAASDAENKPWVVFNKPELLKEPFKFEKTLEHIIASSESGTSTTPAELMQSMIDSQNLTSATNPDSGLDTPMDPRDLESQINPQAAVDEWFPVGVFNRLDTAPLDGSHCGEYRIVYANPGFNAIDPSLRAGAARFFTIFEAAIPNPNLEEGILGCLPIAKFWALLADPDLSDEQRVERLEEFFYQGVEVSDQTIPPAVSFSNYKAPLGQVRTNEFFDSRWQLREFKTAIDANGKVEFAVETVKDNALTEFYNLDDPLSQTNSGLANDFQDTFISALIPLLTSADETAEDNGALINNLSIAMPNQFNEFQSDSQDFSDDITQQAGQGLKNKIDLELGTINNSLQTTITKEHILARAEALSCGGCHEFANNKAIAELSNGTIVRWPTSSGFVHIDEGGNLSPALTEAFLPAREEVLKNLACTEPPGTGIDPVPISLVAHWPLNEGNGIIANDVSGNGHDGLIHGSVWQGEFLSFDGVDDFIGAGDFDVSGEALTLAGWVYSNQLKNCRARDCRIISKATGTAEQDHLWMLSTIKVGNKTRLRFRLKTDDGHETSTLIASSGDLVEGKLFHAAATYDGTTMRLYKNGVEVGALEKNGEIVGHGENIWIGGNPNVATSRPWDGLISDVRVYQQALTSQDLFKVIEETKPSPAISLVAHWPLNEGNGIIANDVSGNGHDGLIHGSVWQDEFLSFDGVDDFIGAGDFDVSGEALTLAGWVYSNQLKNCRARDCRIISKATGTAEQDHLWMLSTIKVGNKTRLRFRLKTDDGHETSTLIASSGDLAEGKLFHAAATYDGTTMRLYKNGVEVGALEKNGEIVGHGENIWIGGNPNVATSRPWDGQISDVRVYQQALTSQELFEVIEEFGGK